MKKFLYTLAVGGLGGVFFGLFLAGFLYRTDFWGSARLINFWLPPLTIKEIEREIITVPAEEKNIREILKKPLESMVAVKSYQGENLVRFGNGLVITQDGLILTTDQVALSGSNYGVFVDGQRLEAKVVKRNIRKKLVLLKIEGENLRPVTFTSEPTVPGSTLYAFGKVVPLNEEEIFIHKMFVNRSSGAEATLEGRYEDYLSGAGLGDREGHFKGIVYIDGRRIMALQSSFLEDFINSFLE